MQLLETRPTKKFALLILPEAAFISTIKPYQFAKEERSLLLFDEQHLQRRTRDAEGSSAGTNTKFAWSRRGRGMNEERRAKP